jgi:murein DD-endopeptidase MepM/ murein hydrolase activator NlpD
MDDGMDRPIWVFLVLAFVLAGPGVATPATTRPPAARATPTPTVAPAPVYSYPIGWPGRPLGDGFIIRHGYTVENTWFRPGWWHTGEDWYALDGSSVGASVYAVAAGVVVYAGANYPGRVVIIQQDDGLFAMYGHLDPRLSVRVGQPVARGDRIGIVGPDGPRAPGHLHFELRTFLTTRVVNGAAPRYRYPCGVNCPPGPGYWPQRAPDHPSEQGWRNPTHSMARRAYPAAYAGPRGAVIVATNPISTSVTLWSAPPETKDPVRSLGTLRLQPGARFVLLDIWAGPEATRATGAQAYQLWYRLRFTDGTDGWVQAAVPSYDETGSDDRPSSVAFNFFPDMTH